jgi:hypothetical protein
VGARDLLDQPMCAQHGKLARHRGGMASLLRFCGTVVGEQPCTDVAITEAIDGELRN